VTRPLKGTSTKSILMYFQKASPAICGCLTTFYLDLMDETLLKYLSGFLPLLLIESLRTLFMISLITKQVMSFHTLT
jgi:hypothetical protein